MSYGPKNMVINFNDALRPKKTWKKQVEEETEKIGLKKEDALRRDKWRDGVRKIAEGMG